MATRSQVATSQLSRKLLDRQRVNLRHHREGPSNQIPSVQREHALKVEVPGRYLCVRAEAAHIRTGGFGCNVNISSDAVTRGTVNYLHHATSKIALIGMTNSLVAAGRLRDHRRMRTTPQRRRGSRVHRHPYRDEDDALGHRK